MSALTAFERFKERVVGKVDAARGRCWLLHLWSPWSVTGRYAIQKFNSYTDKMHHTGKAIVQERACSRCGLTQIKRQKIDICD